VLREDAGFHAYQMLEAGGTQFSLFWGDTDEGRRILIAVIAFVSAFSPKAVTKFGRGEVGRSGSSTSAAVPTLPLE
jgi:hypothetical protein